MCPHDDAALTWYYWDSSAWTAAGAELTVTCPTTASCGCSTVVLTLTGEAYTSQGGVAGSYTEVAGLQQGGGRKVYFNSAGSWYLFYRPTARNWMIGSNYSTYTINLESSGAQGHLCPTSATAWQFWSGSTWMAGGITVSCS